MEVKEAHGRETHVFFAEMFGTCFLVLAVNLQAVFTAFGVFGIAMTLFANILLWGGISGGNFNPAVTLGVYIANIDKYRSHFPLMCVSMFGQVVGGFLGLFLGYVCMWGTGSISAEMATIIAVLQPTYSPWGAFFTEIVCSFFFILIILMVKDPLTAPSEEGYYNCWTVGITLLSCICLAGGVTGAALNPVVGLCINIFMNWNLGQSYWHLMWIYTLGPFVGGALAGIFHHYHAWSVTTVLKSD